MACEKKQSIVQVRKIDESAKSTKKKSKVIQNPAPEGINGAGTADGADGTSKADTANGVGGISSPDASTKSTVIQNPVAEGIHGAGTTDGPGGNSKADTANGAGGISSSDATSSPSGTSSSGHTDPAGVTNSSGTTNADVAGVGDGTGGAKGNATAERIGHTHNGKDKTGDHDHGGTRGPCRHCGHGEALDAPDGQPQGDGGENNQRTEPKKKKRGCSLHSDKCQPRLVCYENSPKASDSHCLVQVRPSINCYIIFSQLVMTLSVSLGQICSV